jgi:hypothetical protein
MRTFRTVFLWIFDFITNVFSHTRSISTTILFPFNVFSLADFGPTVDGVTYSKPPMELIKDGNYNKNVPVIVGSVSDEFGSFALAMEESNLLCNGLRFIRDLVSLILKS